MLKTPLSERLGIRYPIIQGPFGGGLSTVKLLATVANNGGLGSFGAYHLEPEAIHHLAQEIRQATAAPYAINLWVSDHDPGSIELSNTEREKAHHRFAPLYQAWGASPPDVSKPPRPRFEAQVEALLEVRPPVFSFIFGIPSPEILAACRERNIFTIGTATTLAEGLALEAAGVDAVLATGFEAGGHRPSFLKTPEASLTGTLCLVPLLVDRLNIPVIAAGGIADGRGIAAALMLGAEAVQIGTAFLACEESGTIAAHRDALLQADDDRSVLSRAYTGRLARFLPNRLLELLSADPPLPFPWQSWFVNPLKQTAARQNQPEAFSLYASQATPLLRHHRAADLIAALVEETEMCLSRYAPHIRGQENASE